MLCFNYIANIIKLMGLLSREGMRDGNIGICWDAGHIGICGICGTDHLPEIGPAVLPFFGPPPPTCINHKTGTANYQLDEKKRMFIFRLTC
nr:MAG TPA: L-ribulose-5-phosphate 3-epimerase ulaE [Caudoviricetes sp.]